jgi:hypothetical protein
MEVRKLVFFMLTLFITLTGCEKIAVTMTPEKQPVYSNTTLSNQAEKIFWDNFHQGRYDEIPETLRMLTAAYLENPRDPRLAAHLGFTHLWKLAERQREAALDPRIIEHGILAERFFADAIKLSPDARFLGFHAVTQLVEGKIFEDEKEQTRGYFTLKRAIKAWPEFNYFTAGYIMSDVPTHTKHYAEALNWEWRNLDVCVGEKVNRRNPDYSRYMRLETQVGRKRVCWNSWIAPFNFEGFFLNMGDMLVKNGDWMTAIKIYNNAKLARNYEQWPYRNVLEERIANARENVQAFNKVTPLSQPVPDPTIMLNSRFSCMACHQE